MMEIIFLNNNKLISITNTFYSFYFNIVFIINNKTFIINYNKCSRCLIKPDNIDGNLDIFFDLRNSSGFDIIKKNEIKNRIFMKIPSKCYNTLYAFFIYIKYYNIYDDIKVYNTLETLCTYKLFNCRDLYRIISFI